MKAPDKIYAALNTPGTNFVYDDYPFDGHYNYEYISKDLLLKWLEAKVYEHNEDKFDDGFNTAIGQVIDKINSL